MKVFSKEKYIEVEGREHYESGKIFGRSWVDVCDGKEVEKTEDENICKVKDACYIVRDIWCVEKEDKKEDKKEEGNMETRKDIKFEMEKVENVLKGADTFILCSNKGIMAEGTGMELLMCLSEIVSRLKKNGTPEMFLQTAFEIGLEGMPKAEDFLKETGKSEEELKEELTGKLDMLANLIKGLK